MSNTDAGASRYFIQMYGSQRGINRPKFSHTFASFIEKQGPPDHLEVVRKITISWLPRDGSINPFGPPEPGRNYSLDETLTWLEKAGSTKRWVSSETEIQPALFQSAQERIQELEGGVIRYVMIDDMQLRPHTASNCIHAVSDLPLALRTLPMLYTGPLHGIEASYAVYQYLWPFYLRPLQVPEETLRLLDELQSAHWQVAMAYSSHFDTLKELDEKFHKP